MTKASSTPTEIQANQGLMCRVLNRSFATGWLRTPVTGRKTRLSEQSREGDIGAHFISAGHVPHPADIQPLFWFGERWTPARHPDRCLAEWIGLYRPLNRSGLSASLGYGGGIATRPGPCPLIRRPRPPNPSQASGHPVRTTDGMIQACSVRNDHRCCRHERRPLGRGLVEVLLTFEIAFKLSPIGP